MSNDNSRLDFTLKTFKKHNPEIPVLVYNNGGNSEAENVAKKYNCSYKFIPNIWHKQTRCGTGSFNYEWFKYLFEFGLEEDDYTHVLFLETDVYATGPIINEPEFDMSGPLHFCSEKENPLFEYFNLDKFGYKFNLQNNSRFLAHTGCGGTIYKKDFFKKSQKNLPIIQKAYNDVIEHCFMDLIITILGVISDCSIGDWNDVTNFQGKYIYDSDKKDYVTIRCNWNTPLIHNIKYTSELNLILKKIKSIVSTKIVYLKSKLLFF